MNNMAILWKTTSTHIKNTEKQIIKHFEKNKHCKNRGVQAGGVVSNKQIQYLYILTGKNII